MGKCDQHLYPPGTGGLGWATSRSPLAFRLLLFIASAFLGSNCMSDARDGVKEEGRMTFI